MYLSPRSDRKLWSVVVASICIVFAMLVYVVRSWSHVYCLTQDTAGSERYEAMSRIYYRGARAAIVCYGQTLLFCKTQPPVSFFIA